MASSEVEQIPNRVFIGLPWKNVRAKYDRCIDKLAKKYPIHFTIVGRDDAQEADDLLEVIKQRIESSSYGIFDATGGNANVSLEYGYAEAINLPRALYVSTHASSTRTSAGVIISDLGGKRRVEYKNENSLMRRLSSFAEEHTYTVRWEKALRSAFRSKRGPAKTRARRLALKCIRMFDGERFLRRADLSQELQASGYKNDEVEFTIKKLHAEEVIWVSRGRRAKAYIN